MRNWLIYWKLPNFSEQESDWKPRTELPWAANCVLACLLPRSLFHFKSLKPLRRFELSKLIIVACQKYCQSWHETFYSILCRAFALNYNVTIYTCNACKMRSCNCDNVFIDNLSYCWKFTHMLMLHCRQQSLMIILASYLLYLCEFYRLMHVVSKGLI